jgi:hypothetical protein
VNHCTVGDVDLLQLTHYGTNLAGSLHSLSEYLVVQGTVLDISCACVCCCCADIGGAEALGLEDFPLISTGVSNYSPELTKLLSQQANWQMLQLRTQLQQFLQGTNVTVKQAA